MGKRELMADQIERHEGLVKKFLADSPLPHNSGKVQLAISLANLTLLTESLMQQLIEEGELKAEPLRVYNGANSNIARHVKLLRLVPELAGKEPDKDEF